MDTLLASRDAPPAGSRRSPKRSSFGPPAGRPDGAGARSGLRASPDTLQDVASGVAMMLFLIAAAFWLSVLA